MEINVRAALIDRAKLLVIGRKNGGGLFRYELAGGDVEPGERHLDALIRECHEEIGNPVIIHPRVYAISRNRQKGVENWIYLATLACEKNTTTIRLEDCFKRYKWITSKNFEDFRYNPSTRYALEKLLVDGYLK